MNKEQSIETLVQALNDLNLSSIEIKQSEAFEIKQEHLEQIVNQKIEQTVDITLTRTTDKGTIKAAIQWNDKKQTSENFLKELLFIKEIGSLDLVFGITTTKPEKSEKKIAHLNGVLFVSPEQISSEMIEEWFKASFIHVHSIRKGVKSLAYSMGKEGDFTKAVSTDEFLLDQGKEKIPMGELIQELATDDLFAHLGEKITEHEQSYSCPVVLKVQDLSYQDETPVEITEIRLDLLAVRSILKLPVSCLLTMKNSHNTNLVSDFILNDDDVVTTTSQDEQGNDSVEWELDLSRLTERGEVIDDAVVLKGDQSSPDRSFSVKL